MRLSVVSIVEALTGSPVEVAVARRPPEAGGLPAEAGSYAWWCIRAAIPHVPFVAHPSEPDLGLFYVGISPRGPSSMQTIRSRVIRNHLGGNLGSSTFRLTLAALLLEAEDFHPEMRTTKVVLLPDENKRLTRWQERNLRLTWCEAAEPWLLEGQVIRMMNPPLNLAENADHPFHAVVSAARQALRAAAAGASR